MANITLSGLQPTTAQSAIDKTKYHLSATATAVINAVFSSVVKVSNNVAFPSQNFNIANLNAPITNQKSATPGYLIGRRPFRGLLFPRGYYNR